MDTDKLLKPWNTKRVQILFLLVFVIILSVFLLRAFFLSSQPRVIGSCTADLDNDGVLEELYLTAREGSRYGSDLVIRTRAGEPESFDLEALKPWKVQAADVDGDGIKEISVGVYKTAKFHPVMAKRPFIYNYSKGGGLSPKWLGSRLSRPFDDYIFSDVDGDGLEELISIELLSNGRKVLNSYKWKGFGFEGMGESRDFQDIAALQKTDTNQKGISQAAAEVMENETWQHAVFSWQDGKLAEQ